MCVCVCVCVWVGVWGGWVGIVVVVFDGDLMDTTGGNGKGERVAAGARDFS